MNQGGRSETASSYMYQVRFSAFFFNPTQTITFFVAQQNIVLMELFFQRASFQLCLKSFQCVKTHGDTSRVEACFSVHAGLPGTPDSNLLNPGQHHGDVLTNHRAHATRRRAQANFPLLYQV